MANIEANEQHIAALDKIYAKLGYVILYCDDMSDDPQYYGDTLIQIRVCDGRNYMLDTWLGYDDVKERYFVYTAIVVDPVDMGGECLARWLDSDT